MRLLKVMFFGLGLLFSAIGCRNCDLVEAELRTRENEARNLHEELTRSEFYNHALQRELHDLRENSPNLISPEMASQVYTIKEIILGRQTGGFDGDNLPGDEALQVVMEPRDPDGQAIKAPGSLHVVALEVNPEGLKSPFSSWDVPADKLRRSWKSGLFSTGYFIILPWQVWPTSSKVRVVVQFTLVDGRVFEADKDITIHLPSGAPSNNKSSVVPPELPTPRPLEEKAPFPALPTIEPGPLLGRHPTILNTLSKPEFVESTSLSPRKSAIFLKGAAHLKAPVPLRP